MDRNRLPYYYILILGVLSASVSFQTSCLARTPTNLVTDELVLLALKDHITSDPRGIIAGNWTSSTSVCSWIGVACSLRHHRVAALNISDMGITGTIPPHLGNLTFLVSLDLSDNNFAGAVPMELSRLRRLKWFAVNVNNLNGEMPLWFGLLTKLEHLNLRNNSFTSFIPTSISTLSNLEYLDLSFNPLGGTIPEELGNLPRLRHLLMQGNYLTGPIPLPIFNLSTLLIISFAVNQLTSNLPSDMCYNLPFLERINLSENMLSGPIPSNLSQCSQLRAISLSYNHFSGHMPREICMLKYLEFLNLDDNDLEDSEPSPQPIPSSPRSASSTPKGRFGLHYLSTKVHPCETEHAVVHRGLTTDLTNHRCGALFNLPDKMATKVSMVPKVTEAIQHRSEEQEHAVIQRRSDEDKHDQTPTMDEPQPPKLEKISYSISSREVLIMRKLWLL